MATTLCLDKRLRPAKVIGIILFVISIVYFASGMMAGLMTLLMFPNTTIAFGRSPFFSNPMDWMFKNITTVFFSLSIFCVPLFFASRALFRFKEWGRKVCIALLFVAILFVIGYGYVFASVSFAPLLFRLIVLMFIMVYVGAVGVPIYFLMRRSTKEGIRDHNEQQKNTVIPV